MSIKDNPTEEFHKTYRSYKKFQGFNFITKYLHNNRYRNLEKLIIHAAKEKNNKLKIVDIGCGPAKAFEIINRLDIDFEYIGVELGKDFYDIAYQNYNHFENFDIIHDSIEYQLQTISDADVIICLESFEHIPEWLVVQTIQAISKVSFMYLYVTVPNEIGPAILIKNLGSALMGYKRYKEYKWSETFYASVYNLDKVTRHGTGHIGFDWRWLAHTLRQNTSIFKKTSSPFNLIPKFISPSIGFICVKKS
jgi:SAM-dependent methyltransferase